MSDRNWRNNNDGNTHTGKHENDDQCAHKNCPKCRGLIGTEVSEAIEAARHGDNENYMEELADVVIRVMDEAERVDRLGTQRRTLLDWIEAKQQINRERPRLHGKVT